MRRSARFAAGWALALALAFAFVCLFARGAAVEFRQREREGREACARASAGGLSLAGCPRGVMTPAR